MVAGIAHPCVSHVCSRRATTSNRVRRLTDAEGQRRQRIVRRSHGKSATRYRRALVALASASGNDVEVIARLISRSLVPRARSTNWSLIGELASRDNNHFCLCGRVAVTAPSCDHVGRRVRAVGATACNSRSEDHPYIVESRTRSSPLLVFCARETMEGEPRNCRIVARMSSAGGRRIVRSTIAGRDGRQNASRTEWSCTGW